VFQCSPAVEKKVVPPLLYTAAFRSDAGLAYVYLADAALKVAPTPVFRHLASLTCIQNDRTEQQMKKKRVCLLYFCLIGRTSVAFAPYNLVNW